MSDNTSDMERPVSISPVVTFVRPRLFADVNSNESERQSMLRNHAGATGTAANTAASMPQSIQST